jgi:collagenase-like PrtC family protease
MLKYDLPFHFNPGYKEYIQNSVDCIHSLYYAATQHIHGDARIRTSCVAKEDAVQMLQDIDTLKYMTLNGRMTPISEYADARVADVVQELNFLYHNNALTGIIIVDFYYLKLLANAGLSKELDVIPSVNVALDSIAKVNSTIQMLLKIGFKAPTKIILDRGLNRNLEQLIYVSDTVKAEWSAKIELLVNEGCIQHCPFKVNHDIIISMTSSHAVSDRIALIDSVAKGFDANAVNESIGCIKHFKENPDDLLKIPFIRPEDIELYEPYFDIIKISGKTRSDAFVMMVFEAYQERVWEGNLLDLLDATGPSTQNYHIFNDQLPKNFAKMLSSCESKCHTCDYCTIQAHKHIQSLSKT